MSTEKEELRTRLLSLREGMNPAVARRGIRCRLRCAGSGPCLSGSGKDSFLYAPQRGGGSSPIDGAWLAGGKASGSPRSVPHTRELELYRIDSFGDVVRGTYGIREPVPMEGNRVAPEDVELVLVPGSVLMKSVTVWDMVEVIMTGFLPARGEMPSGSGWPIPFNGCPLFTRSPTINPCTGW